MNDGGLVISPATLEQIFTHASEARPRECCGVLIGTTTEIVSAVPTRNLAALNDRYFIDPKDHIDARRNARTRGLEVIGFYHSHPHSDPYPSSRDLAEASYSGCFYLIVGFASEQPKSRLFRLDGERFSEVDLQIR